MNCPAFAPPIRVASRTARSGDPVGRSGWALYFALIGRILYRWIGFAWVHPKSPTGRKCDKQIGEQS
jgi:hypothetical protein